MDRNKHLKPQHLLGPPITEFYEPEHRGFIFNLYFNPHRPYFTRWYIQPMLQDPRITFGMMLLSGPILASSRFFIDTPNLAVKDYLAKQLNRLWVTAAPIALKAMEYGYQPAEIMYRPKEGRLGFDSLKYLHPADCKPVVKHGQLVGIKIEGSKDRHDHEPLYMGVPKAYWGVHNKAENPWWGRSRLKGAFYPWYEYWCVRGYRDMRRQWFHRNAFTGPVITYPRGASPPVNQSGTTVDPVSNQRLALQMIDKYISGNGLAIPADVGWEVQTPQSMSVPEGLLEYGDSLRDEEWEGMGIPPEVARAEGTGAFGGRRVPQQAFYAILQDLTQGIITDFDAQILRPLVALNFGGIEDYEIQVFGLLRETGEEQEGQIEQSQNDSLVDQGNESLAASDITTHEYSHTGKFDGFVLAEQPHPDTVLYRGVAA